VEEAGLSEDIRVSRVLDAQAQTTTSCSSTWDRSSRNGKPTSGEPSCSGTIRASWRYHLVDEDRRYGGFHEELLDIG
jgi:hypothetical protein